jgi:hypothetical protein
MILYPKHKIPYSVVFDIQNHHPTFAVMEDHGYLGKKWFWAAVDLSDREYIMFLLRWGEYFK